MKKENLIIVEIVDGCVSSTDISIGKMVEEGIKLLNEFRSNPMNQSAIQESIKNMLNPDYKISKYGEMGSFFLFVNCIYYILSCQRETIIKKITFDKKQIVWDEITGFYILYTIASLHCLDLQMTTMSDITKALKELRDHFMYDYLIKYVNYL